MDFFKETKLEHYSSPFNYTGSKFRILDQIIPLFKKRKTFIDVFCGGGSVFTNVEDKYENIIVNDKLSPLIDFYRKLQEINWEDIRREVLNRKVNPLSQEEYLKLRDRYNAEFNCYDFFMLVCSCTNNMSRFNQKGEFNQTWGKRTYNEKTERKLHNFWKTIYNNRKITFLNGDYSEVNIDEDSFVYLDPPYLITSAGYNTLWNSDDDTKLYAWLDNLNKRGVLFAMSNVSRHNGVINPFMDRINQYKVLEINQNYGKVSRRTDSTSTEILITNY